MATRRVGLALLRACEQGKLSDVKTLTTHLLTIPTPKETNPPLIMAMGAAALHGHADSLRHLMASIPQDRWQGSSGPWNPIVIPPFSNDTPKEWHVARMSDYVVFLAAAGGTVDVMQALLDAGLEVNHAVEKMGSALSIAISNRKEPLVRFLLARGANPNGSRWFPPASFLNRAAAVGSKNIMQALIDHGATVEGSNALEGAAENGHIAIATFLLELGADLNEVLRDGQSDHYLDIIGTPLHVAVRHEQEGMVKFLLNRGARQDLLDGRGYTAKELAIQMGNAAIIRLF